MRKQKALALILALAMVALLPGCGSRGETPADSSLEEAVMQTADEIALEGGAEATAEEGAIEAGIENAAEEAGTQAVPEGFDPDFRFSTATLDGEPADESILAGATLTMINFFEPWCGPCVAELPELERLYETYAPQGFRIIGVFETEEGVRDVLQDAGITYTILRYEPAFDRFQTGYVPTTIFVDGQGHVVGETQIGSNSYEGWERIIKDLMG